MLIKTYSYRFAEEILSSPDFIFVKQEILDICELCPVPVYKGKSANQKNKDVVQQIMNTYFRIQFEEHGWLSEPLATPEDNEDALRADFRKKFICSNGKEIAAQIEVEFGNVASSYRNYFKFQLSFSYGLTDLCVLIVPSANLANRIDSGVANYEKAIREIPQAKLSVTVPTLVIGLFDRDENGVKITEWDVKSLGTTLDVAQNKNKAVTHSHETLVHSYIDEH